VVAATLLASATVSVVRFLSFRFDAATAAAIALFLGTILLFVVFLFVTLVNGPTL
jgi:hypothetical protein